MTMKSYKDKTKSKQRKQGYFDFNIYVMIELGIMACLVGVLLVIFYVQPSRFYINLVLSMVLSTVGYFVFSAGYWVYKKVKEGNQLERIRQEGVKHEEYNTRD